MTDKRIGYQISTPRNLFWRRLKEYLREQIIILRYVADWTVMLYILIPGVLLGGRLYYGLWVEDLPQWSLQAPSMLFSSFMLLGIYSGGILLLVQRGDALFIRMHQRWMSGLIFRGSIYSMVVIAMKVVILFTIVSPFLVRILSTDGLELGSFLVLSIATSWIVTWIRHFVTITFSGWTKRLMIICGVGVPCAFYARVTILWIHQPLYMICTAVLFIIVVFVFVKKRVYHQGTFMNDVEEDSKQRMKFTGFLLKQVVDKPMPTRTKPWIFRRSPYLYHSRSPEHRLAAAAVKSWFRNPRHLLLYLQFTGVSVIAIIVPPGIIKCIVLLAVSTMLVYWLFRYWTRFLYDEWVSLLPWSPEVSLKAGMLAVRTMHLPYIFVISTAFSLTLWGIGWGWLFILPLTLVMNRFTVYLLSFMNYSKG
ncbi:ABC-2 type transport system permease protein [Paenibacillus sp. DS2015]|uniref:ABC transporter permease n=1 Tax=Paenibacillus sp. DS2015 TaxID=3373917 RepID=UPI003D1F9046